VEVDVVVPGREGVFFHFFLDDFEVLIFVNALQEVLIFLIALGTFIHDPERRRSASKYVIVLTKLLRKAWSFEHVLDLVRGSDPLLLKIRRRFQVILLRIRHHYNHLAHVLIRILLVWRQSLKHVGR